MRITRSQLFRPGEAVTAHVVSRIVDRQFKLDDEEKEVFVGLMRRYEEFCRVRVLTFCVLSNHFHLLLEVPELRWHTSCPEGGPSDEELIEHVTRTCPSQFFARDFEWRLKHYRTFGTPEPAQRLRQALLNRLGDLSGFMKAFKQHFTQWFNRTHQRKGTLWEDRFKSILVEGRGDTLLTMACYIDLNPIRAGIVSDPKDYRWSGYGAAEGGDAVALAGIARIRQEFGASKDKKVSDLAWYRGALFGRAEESGVQGEGSPIRRGVSKERIDEVLASKEHLEPWEVVRCRVRYFCDGVAIGSKGFVESIFDRIRECLGPRRRTGARRCRGLSDIHCLRDLRKDVIEASTPLETGSAENP